MVVLCNVAQFSPARGRGPGRVSQAGGGLVVFGGDQVIADNYNRLLYADGKGLLPAAVGPAMGDAAKKRVGVLLQSAGLSPSSDCRVPWRVGPGHGRADPRPTWQYHKLVLPKGSEAQVALAFDTGDPAVIEAPRRRGKVILVATSADAGWTTWPLHNSYLPVMQQMVLQAAAGRLCGTEHPGRPALRPVVRRGRRVGDRHGDHPQGTTGRGQAQEQRRGQPASFRADRAVRAVPGADRSAPRR